MFMLVHNATAEPVASFMSRTKAEEFMSALSKRSDYVLFERVSDELPYHLRNRDSIIRDLREIAQTKKITAIKLYRSIFAVGLTEAKMVVEGTRPSF